MGRSEVYVPPCWSERTVAPDPAASVGRWKYSPPWRNASTPTRSSVPRGRASSNCAEGYGPAFECWAAIPAACTTHSHHSEGRPRAGTSHPRPLALLAKFSPRDGDLFWETKKRQMELSCSQPLDFMPGLPGYVSNSVPSRQALKFGGFSSSLGTNLSNGYCGRATFI
jgi:hypothetical protein